MALLKPEEAPDAEFFAGFTPFESAAPAAPVAPHNSDLGLIEVSSELALIFSSGKALLDSVLGDDNVPANQRAQVLNSVSSILEKITKTRTELYNAEMVRRIEQTLIKVMKDQPKEIQEAFFEQYERALGTS